MDDQVKDDPHPERPQKRKRPKQLLTDNVPTDDVENTAQIGKEIYYSSISRRLFPEDQKGCHQGTRRPRELQYVDLHILNESKTKRKKI